MSCLDYLVTTGICPDEPSPTSGFEIIQAPGISMINMAKIATETYTSGLDLLKEKKKLAIAQLTNDFVREINAMKVIADIDNRRYDTSEFTATDMGVSSNPRGVVVHPVCGRGSTRKVVLHSVELRPVSSGDTTLTIIYGGTEISYSVTLIGGEVNTFDANNLDGFPLMIDSAEKEIRVLVDQSDIPFYSAKIQCLKGCDGRPPNSCGWADGWDGSRYSRGESFGVSVNFGCQCDYASVLCENGMGGELLWLRWQINIFEEQLLSNRFNGWVIFNQERIHDDILPALYARYEDRWAAMMGSLPVMLRSRRDDCFECRQIRWAVSI